MPQPPYAKVRASINGGAIQTGGLTIAASSTVQLSADPGGAVGISQYRWEIYDFPPTYAQPTGWSTDANGIYYSTVPTPPVFTVGSTSIFGKYMIRLTANGGVSPNPRIKPISDLIDEFTSVEVLALSGIHDIGYNETNQWSSFKSWLYHLKADLRIIDTAINGGFSGGGVTAHGALTGLSNDDHTQYLRTDGTRALTGNWSAGSHKITSLLDPTAAQDAATKAYVDAAAPSITGVIRANGSVAFTASQSMAGFKLTSLGTPTVSTDAATKGYVDLQIVPAGTNPFTGPQSMGGFKLTSVAAPTVGTDAANKTYVDAAAAATIVPAGTTVFAANQSMGGFKLTNLGTPTASTDAVTKAYADALPGVPGPAGPPGAQVTVHLATNATPLPTNARTGSVITASANGALSVDGALAAVGARILVTSEAAGANNGIYSVTIAGSGAAPWVLTRTSDVISSGMTVSVTGGTLAGSLAILKTEGTITVNTTTLVFAFVSGAGGGGGGSSQVLSSAADTTAGYLYPKLAAGLGITLTVVNPGANETVQIDGPQVSTIAAVLTAGNATGGNDLVCTAGDRILGAAGVGTLGGPLAISGGTGAATLAGGAVNVTGGTGGTTSGNGGLAQLSGGPGTGTGTGGAAVVAGGVGGASGAGSLARVIGGAGGATSGAGGGAQIFGGVPVDGAGGDITITASNGVGTNRAGGSVSIAAGNGTGGGANGNTVIVAGVGGSGGGGQLLCQAGSSNGFGSAAKFIGGNGVGAASGADASLLGGNGGSTGSGANAVVTGGFGGATSGAAGGAIVAGGVPTVGNGGAVIISGSAGAGAGSHTGGGVTLRPGAGINGGASGALSLQNSAGATKIQINDTGVGLFGFGPVAQPTITGSRGGNAALASLLTLGATLGLWIDGTTA